MATKKNSKCIENAKDDEPIFTLRAQDRYAPSIVRMWVQMTGLAGTAKGEEALLVASQMEKWADQNGSKVPD